MWENQSFSLHQSRRLFQEYITDIYGKVETCRLNYIKIHQDEILYQGIVDATQRGDTNAGALGSLTILPSSFVGGPRHMHKLYQDSLVLVRHFGNPDLFITMTCNANWPEINVDLFPGQRTMDLPDLVSRIFQIEKCIFEDIIVKFLMDKWSHTYIHSSSKREGFHMYIYC